MENPNFSTARYRLPEVATVPDVRGMADLGMGSDRDQRLRKARIIWVSGVVTSELADRVCPELLMLDADDPDRDIQMYINSPGGSVSDGLAIYDTMQLVRCDVQTTVLGMAASMGQFLLCAGAPGKRRATPNSRVLMHQPSGGMQGQATDIEIQMKEIQELKYRLAALTAFHTGQSVERITEDADRDRWFTADEALAYGFIDEVIRKEGQPVLATRGEHAAN
jgi:ATP-dependent Clp protease protease subunit